MSRPTSIHEIQDAELSTINMLVYGHPGEGKTPFWGTGGERLLLMDSDNGYESAIASGSKAHRVPVTSYDELDEVYLWLKDSGYKEFDWVVWDSLTLFQDRALIDDIMPDAIAERKNVGSPLDAFVPSKREYFVDHNRIGSFVRKFVGLPINFGISCHVMIDQDFSDGSSLWMPAVQGKNMASKICGYMNIIGLLGHTPERVPRMLTQRQGKFYARDRFGVLGAYVDNPTVPKITAAVEARRNGMPAATATPIRRRRRRVS